MKNTQKQKKKEFGFQAHGAKSCATCKFLLEASPEDEIICDLTGIIVEDTLTGAGNETAMSICDKWERNS